MTRHGVKGWKVRDSKPTLWQKLNRKHEFTVFSKLEKSLVLCTILFGATFFSSFVYYSVSAVSASQPSLNGDPFTPVWNGSIYNTPSTGNPQVKVISPILAIRTGCSACITTLPLNIGNLLLVASTLGPCAGISDNRTNIYSTLTTTTPFGLSKVFGSKITYNGNTLITLTGCSTTAIQTFTVYTGGSNFGTIAQIDDQTGPATPLTSTLSLTTSVGSSVFESFAFTDLGGPGCDFPTAQNSQIKILESCVVNGGLGSDSTTWNKAPTTGTNNYGILISGLGGANINYAHVLVEIKTNLSNLPCPSGYKCINSYVNNNDIVLQANSTISAIALNNVPIDFSVLSAKEMMIYETYVNGSNISGNNKPFGWYLTINGTLPLQANYSPLNDTRVAMAMVNYDGKTTYLYIAKNLGEQLLPDSGLGNNPYPNCPQSSTLFLCGRVIVSLSGSTFNAMSAILNFTGPAQQNRGVSFICFNSVLTASFFTFGGASCNGNTTTTLPWFNIQNSYSLGFFAQAGQNASITFGSSGTSTTFSERANAVYYWVPNPTTNTPAETNSGGYFG